MSAKCRSGIGDLKSYIGRRTSRPTIDWLSTDYPPSVDRVSIDSRPSVDRVSIERRPSVDRVSTATSTDIAVDVAVDTTYSKHDPITNWLPPTTGNFMLSFDTLNGFSRCLFEKFRDKNRRHSLFLVSSLGNLFWWFCPPLNCDENGKTACLSNELLLHFRLTFLVRPMKHMQIVFVVVNQWPCLSEQNTSCVLVSFSPHVHFC